MSARTAAVITLAIILAVALAELSCVANEMVSPAEQDAFVDAGDTASSSASTVELHDVAVPVIAP